MYNVSAQFRATVQASHRANSRLTAIDRYGASFEIPVNTGTVTIDSTTTPWGVLECEVSDERFWPTGSAAVLAPYGTVLLPERGIVLPDGTTEFVPLGQYRVTSSDLTESASDGTVVAKVKAYDMSQLIKRNLFVDPFTIAGGVRTSEAIKMILVNRFPAGKYPTMESIRFVNRMPKVEDALISYTQTFGVVTGATQRPDPWADCQKLASSIGAWLYIDAKGQWILEPIPEPKLKDVSWVIREGNGGTLVGAERTLEDTNTYNGIVLTCSHRKHKPFRVEFWDTNPKSATYYKGPFGKAPKMVTTKLCSTHQQGLVMAKSLFRANCGFTDSIIATIPPNPAIEIADINRVVRERLGVDAPYVVDSVVVPINIDADMTVTMRPQAAFL